MTMLRDINLVIDGKIDSTDPRVGVPASEIPTGFERPALPLNDVDAAFPNRLYSVEILTLPALGTLFVGKRGEGFFEGAPVGTYTGTQRVRKYDPGVGLVSDAIGPYTIQVDPAPPTIISVTVSPAVAAIAGGAQQQFAAVAAGTNSPPQGFTWATTIGQIDANGVVTAPAATNALQSGVATATSIFDPTKKGAATMTVAALPLPTVTGVLVSPATAIVEGGGVIDFSAAVLGANGPSQDVTWATTLGQISSQGQVLAPPASQQALVGTVTATSALDQSKSGTATFTVLAQGEILQPPEVRTVSIILGEAYGPAANLQNLMVAVYVASGPHATGVAIYQSATESTDEYGVLSFSLNSDQVSLGDIVLLAVLAPDGRHYLGLVAVE